MRASLDDRGFRRGRRRAAARAIRRASDRRRLDRQPHDRDRRCLRRDPRRAPRRPRLRRRSVAGRRGAGASSREGRAPAAVGPLLVVPDDPLDGARTDRRGGARAHAGRGRRRHRIGRQDRHQGDAPPASSPSSAPTHAPVGSFNNQWGVPLTLARMPAETRFGVFEIGMNHPGEIRPLVKLVRPHVAIVTTVEPVHLAYFDSEAAIAEAKAEIFEGLEPGGTAVLNRDNAGSICSPGGRGSTARGSCRFGEHASADVRLERVALQRGRVERAGAALRRARDLPARRARAPSGAELARRARRRACARRRSRRACCWRSRGSARRRGEASGIALPHPAGAFTLIDESYNANPASMRAALALLAPGEPAGARAPHRGARRMLRAWRGRPRRRTGSLPRRSSSRTPTSCSWRVR